MGGGCYRGKTQFKNEPPWYPLIDHSLKTLHLTMARLTLNEANRPLASSGRSQLAPPGRQPESCGIRFHKPCQREDRSVPLPPKDSHVGI